jgi:hypothetical protein
MSIGDIGQVGGTMIDKLINFIHHLFSRKPVRLAIVRRYQDANGNYVGELYIGQRVNNDYLYNMIGVSLDSLPLDVPHDLGLLISDFDLDTAHDFLAYMPSHCVRVGALDPADNDNVRAMVAVLPRKRMTLAVHNGFIEHPTEIRQ